MNKLLADIWAFCAENEMPPTKLGEAALKDPAFVHKLKKGRRVWPETEAKVRNFMATYKAERAA